MGRREESYQEVRSQVADICPPLSDGSAMLYLEGGATATATRELVAKGLKIGDVVLCLNHTIAYAKVETCDE